jgi:tetratricopeptide (TPR) repeat protein
MARRLMPLVLLAALLAPAAAHPGQDSGQAATRPEASDHITQGIAHYERAFFDLTPKKRQAEAEAEYDLAVAAFQRELAVRPASAAAHRHLARVYAVRGQHARAARAYDELARLDPSDLDAYVLAALAYVELEQFDAARDRLMDARSRALDPRAQATLDEYLAKLAAHVQAAGPGGAGK